jgi:hypothetical protein
MVRNCLKTLDSGFCRNDGKWYFLTFYEIINYLKATNIEVGLLLNFGRKPEFKRFVYNNKRKNISDDQRRSAAE